MRSVPARPAARLSAFYAAAFLVTGIQLPFWPVWLAGRGLGPKEIALVLTAAIWANVLAAPPLGMLADRLGRRRAIMVALAAVALSAYAALAAVAGFAALLLVNALAATAQSALMPLGNTITLSGPGLDYGRIRLWGSLSFILASLVGGAVLGAGSAVRVLPLVIGASALLLLACLAVPPLAERRGAHHRRPGLSAVAGDKRFWLFAATASVLQASHQLYYGFGTLYWRSLGYSDAVIGALWAEGVVAEILLFWQGSRLLARFGPLGLMALGGGAGILRWGLMGLVSSQSGFAGLQLLHALTFGASHLGAMLFLARTIPPSAAASAQTLYAAISSGLGSGLVMLAAGALYGALGGTAFPVMALLSAAGLLGTLRLRHGGAAR
ncbi:MAG TPA: MFS transporter [Stellaceae bacterium]|nr:MFS transporter [Stellaceae bacterium]